MHGGADVMPLKDYAAAAEHLGVPMSWLQKRISTLPHHKLGHYVRFTEHDLEQIAELGVRASTPVVAVVPVPLPKRRRTSSN